MAYGKNKDRKDWHLRAFPAGIGEVTKAKKESLKLLLSRGLELMRAMSGKCFLQEPLAHDNPFEHLEDALIEMQTKCTNLNAVWAEAARKAAKSALEESTKRYFKRLSGSLRHVDTTISTKTIEPSKSENKRLAEFVGPLLPQRKWVHVPWEFQDEILPEDLSGLKAIAEDNQAIPLFKRVILNKDYSGLTTNQIKILQDIHRRTQEKHSMPDFGAKGQFIWQLHLDYRMLPNVKRKGPPDKPSEAKLLRDGEAYILRDDKNRKYQRFLEVSGVEPRQERIRIPVILNRKIVSRMQGTRQDWASIILELGTNREEEFSIGVRLVCGKQPEPAKVDMTAVTTIQGRDFGYANTITLSVARSLTPMDLSGFTGKQIINNSKEEAKAYFESRVRPDNLEIIEQVMFQGRNFLSKIAEHCDKIDAYKSRIDLAYNNLEKLRKEIFRLLGLKQDELITSDMKKTFAGNMVRDFFQLFGQINDLKKARRALYRKIVGLKKSWFGYLSNKEVALAKKHGAVIVRENLTAEAIEKEAPEYKGRIFNRMMNNGSKGQYQKRASDKLDWNGIPELLIGSWYTSRSCTRHSKVIEKKHRKGEEIFLECCGKHDHADKHASETIASYLFLQPRITESGNARSS